MKKETDLKCNIPTFKFKQMQSQQKELNKVANFCVCNNTECFQATKGGIKVYILNSLIIFIKIVI